jgi:hypothetical protein
MHRSSAPARDHAGDQITIRSKILTFYVTIANKKGIWHLPARWQKIRAPNFPKENDLSKILMQTNARKKPSRK